MYFIGLKPCRYRACPVTGSWILLLYCILILIIMVVPSQGVFCEMALGVKCLGTTVVKGRKSVNWQEDVPYSTHRCIFWAGLDSPHPGWYIASHKKSSRAAFLWKRRWILCSQCIHSLMDALFISDIMDVLLIVQLRCTVSLMVMGISRSRQERCMLMPAFLHVFVPGSYTSREVVEDVHMCCLVYLWLRQHIHAGAKQISHHIICVS